jgi:acetyl-CoA carboxylase biotin carboxyl carrier protein
MDIIKTTDALAKILSEKNLSYIRVKNNETEIEVGMPEPQFSAVHAAMPAYSAMPAPIIQPAPVIQPAVVQAAPAPVQAPAEPAPAAAPSPSGSGNIVKSPIIGTFYSSPSPEKPAFVKVGDKVTKGQVICIVESMKLMNEINSEFDGTVAEIYVKDAAPVEFDQKLMRIE